jgi:hypothetical protein
MRPDTVVVGATGEANGEAAGAAAKGARGATGVAGAGAAGARFGAEAAAHDLQP